MKGIIKFYLFLMLIFWYGETLLAQHKISVYAGWTMSQLQKEVTPEYKNKPYYSELYALPPLHSPYFSMEYEYNWNRFRFSTGLSFMVLGSSNAFNEKIAWGNYYLNIPIIAGYRCSFAKNLGLTLEAGIEVGVSTADAGIVFVGYKDKLRGNINAIIGVEMDWRQFRIGTRLQIGVTEYQVVGGQNRDIVLRHSALTTYIGYTLWDSERAKEQRAKRLSKTQ